MTRSHAVDASAIHSRLERLVATDLQRWLPAKRWFADKGRPIVEIRLEDAMLQPVADDWLALAIIRVTFNEGEAARYHLPLAWTRAPAVAAAIGEPESGSEEGAFVDATETPWFGRWLVQAMIDGDSPAHPAWRFSAYPAAAARLVTARDRPSELMRGEQSNSSLRFGDVLIVKLVRRLQPGPNADEEMLSALADRRFTHVPSIAGAASWRSGADVAYPIALAQAFVPNRGDGWSWMLARLARLALGEIEPMLGDTSPEWVLGQRTGELHVALAEIDALGFTPEPSSSQTIAANEIRTRAAVDQAGSLLQAGTAPLPDALQRSLPQTIRALEASASRVAGYRHEAPTWRIRVHGDFHLGQTLRTPDGDWKLIDFEGEPARTAAERRQKTSALKDVAGMLRSFAYARGAAERTAEGSDFEHQQERLDMWERAAREAFLAGYRNAVQHAPNPLVPDTDDAFASALAAWELDKTLYEIAYEIRNRPDWLALPLRALVQPSSE